MLSNLKLKYESFVRNLSCIFEEENVLTVRSNTSRDYRTSGKRKYISSNKFKRDI